MTIYRAPIQDTLFVLNDVLGYQRYSNLQGFSDATPDVLEAILAEGAKLAENVMFGAAPAAGSTGRPTTCRRPPPPS